MSTLTQTKEGLPTGTWQADVVHSHVGFAVGYVGGTFRGTFSPFDARLDVGPDGSTRLTGSARADSVKVLDENLNAHLLTPDFFDAERAPVLQFASEAFTTKDAVARGELTVKGTTVPVELQVQTGELVVDAYGRARVALQLETTVDRRAFGIDWNMELPSGDPALANDVTLTAELFLIKE
jgi:polyisoprenoid-binding protein YceI